MSGALDRQIADAQAALPARLARAEAALAALSGALTRLDVVAVCAALEPVLEDHYACDTALQLSRAFGRPVAQDLQARAAELRADARYAEHFAVQQVADPAALPDRLRPWAAAMRAPRPAPLPEPDPPPTGDPVAYAAALNAALHPLSPESAARLRAGSLHLPEDVVAALVEMADRPPAPPDDVTGCFGGPAEVLQIVRDHLAQGPHVGPFVQALLAQDRIHVADAMPDGYAFSVAPEYRGLPIVYVPFTGGLRDLVQVFHHVGHSFHRFHAQAGGSVLSAMGPDIDEALPLLFERRCHDVLSAVWPTRAAAAQARRAAEVADALAHFAFAQRLVRAALTGDLTAEALIGWHRALLSDPLPDVLAEAPGFSPPPLSSYALGAVQARRFHARHGWDAAAILALAERADRVRCVELLGL